LIFHGNKPSQGTTRSHPRLAALRSQEPALKGRSLVLYSWFSLLLAIGLALLLSTSLAGCGAANPHPAGSFERAAFYAERGKNLEAVTALESFVRRNPTDSLASEAQYLKAMAYLDMKELPLAAVEFQILRKDYPTSDRVEDAFFQEGVAYFRQVNSVERDVTGGHEARLHFLKFSQEYPNSKHMDQVRDYMAQISDIMVAKRLRQSKVFWQLKRFKAIDMTLASALKNEAGSTLLDKVMWERGRANEKLDQLDTAREMYRRLVDEYPDSSLADRARGALRRLEEKAASDADEE
jgi:outer membrane assembly lipoprotein YfiO